MKEKKLKNYVAIGSLAVGLAAFTTIIEPGLDSSKSGSSNYSDSNNEDQKEYLVNNHEPDSWNGGAGKCHGKCSTIISSLPIFFG